mgnify:CR=1 FL=1
MKFTKSLVWVICISVALLNYNSPFAQTIYVAVNGNDQYPGTKAKPIVSFSKAQELVRKSGDKNAKVIFLPENLARSVELIEMSITKTFSYKKSLD